MFYSQKCPISWLNDMRRAWCNYLQLGYTSDEIAMHSIRQASFAMWSVLVTLSIPSRQLTMQLRVQGFGTS